MARLLVVDDERNIRVRLASFFEGCGHVVQTAESGKEALELLALSELIARKAAYGRQLTVRSARVAGASWTQIGAALGTTKQSAWEAHNRWIDQQANHRSAYGHLSMDSQQAAAARALAGNPDNEGPE